MSMERNHSQSYAFITAYLLGVEMKVLEKGYIEDFVYSEGLQLLKHVENVETVRNLSRVKQSIFRNFSMYKETTNFKEIVKGYYDVELDYLMEQGIDLYKEFQLSLDISHVLNVISSHLNDLVPKVLEELKFPYIEQVVSYFYMYATNLKDLQRLLGKIKDDWNKFPHGILIIRYNRLHRHLPYVLQNDKNLIACGYILNGQDKNFNEIEIPSFDWSLLSNEYSQVTIPIPNGATIYVDCDNTDFFNFLALLDILESNKKEYSSPTQVKLFLDDMTAPYWGYAEKLKQNNFNFIGVEVNRIKDAKSVVDIVITSHMTRDSLQSETPQVLISSDSDFFGLIESGIDYFLLYESQNVSHEYITYLNRNKIKHFDIGSINTAKYNVSNRNAILTYMGLEYLSKTPLTEWDNKKLSSYVSSNLQKDLGYDITLLNGELESLFDKVYKDLSITRDGDKVALSALGVDLIVKPQIDLN